MSLRQLSMVGQTATVLGLVALSYQTYQLDKNLDSAIHDRKELNAKFNNLSTRRQEVGGRDD